MFANSVNSVDPYKHEQFSPQMIQAPCPCTMKIGRLSGKKVEQKGSDLSGTAANNASEIEYAKNLPDVRYSTTRAYKFNSSEPGLSRVQQHTWMTVQLMAKGIAFLAIW